MDILEKIIELQGQGFSDEEIYQRLRNDGVSPKEIYNAVNQAKVKKAVSAENGNESPENEINEDDFIQTAPRPIQESPPAPVQENYAPAQPPEQTYQENYYTPTPQAYSQQEYYTPQNAVDMTTISEIAEQIVSEKIEELKKETRDFSIFKTRIEEKVGDIDERLKRIEGAIDKLQQAVVGKISEFGENTSLIHKDLDNLHNTVSKLMNPLVDNYNELKKISRK